MPYIPADDEEQKREIERRWDPEEILTELGVRAKRVYAHQKDMYIVCPYHADEGAHCSVHRQIGIFRCLHASCGVQGDFWKLLMQLTGRNFGQLVVWLGQMPNIDVGQPKLDRDARSSEERIQLALKAYVKMAHECLLMDADALDFLYDRGISEATIMRYQWGYAPPSVPIPKSPLYNEQDLVNAGLLLRRDTGLRRTFSNRVTLPVIVDRKVVDIQARTISDETKPKYMNLPGRQKALWGLENAQPGQVTVVCEGIFDAAMSTQVGIPAVAILGGDQTHLGWLDMLPQETCFVLAFDGDKAGQVVTEKVGKRLAANGHVVKVAKMEEGEDPASLILRLMKDTGDVTEWWDRVGGAAEFPVWLLGRIPADKMADPFARQTAMKPVMEVLKTQDPIYQQGVIELMAQHARIAPKVLRMQLNALGSGRQKVSQ